MLNALTRWAVRQQSHSVKACRLSIKSVQGLRSRSLRCEANHQVTEIGPASPVAICGTGYIEVSLYDKPFLC